MLAKLANKIDFVKVGEDVEHYELLHNPVPEWKTNLSARAPLAYFV